MIFFYISLSTYLCYQVLKYKKGIILLNEAKGSLKKYSKSLIKNKKELFFTPELLVIILIIVAVNANAKITGICFVIFYMLMFLYMFRKKEKLTLNKSNISLIVILLILFLLISVLFYFNNETLNSGFLIFDATWIYYIVFIILSYFSYIVLLIAAIINKPFELIFKKKKHK